MICIYFRPQYSNEIYNILCGSKSEQIFSRFLDNDIDLYRFLSMTDKELQAVGITMPFQRYKILNGLYRFHKHQFVPTSVPTVQTDELYRCVNCGITVLVFYYPFFSNMETAKSVATATRQLVSMEATINYLIANADMFRDNIDKSVFRNSLHNICERIIKLRSTSRALHRRAKYVSV